MTKARYLVCAFVLTLVAWPLAGLRAAPRCYPTTRFVVQAGGLVQDTLTQLVWQRASSAEMTWAAANTYCSSAGFRLPTVKELSSLLDLTVTSGALIDLTAFPGTAAYVYWTSSPSLLAGDYRWYVNFGDGWSGTVGVGSNYPARCVR